MKWVTGCSLILVLYQSVPAQTPDLVLPVGHTSSVSTAAYSPDGKYVVSASWDNTVMIWLSPEGRLLHELKGHKGSLTSASYSNDGKLIVTTSKDSTAIIWRAADGKVLHELKGHTDWVNAASFSPDDKNVVTASWDNSIKVWDTKTGRLTRSITNHKGPVSAVAYSGDGKYIISASKDNTSKLFNAADGKMILDLKGHSDWVNGAEISGDKKLIVTASKDGTARIWQFSNGKLLNTLKGHANAINTTRFNSSSQNIVTASNDGTAKIWSTNTGKLIASFIGHTAPVVSASFSLDGKYIVTASADNTAAIWHSGTGKLISELKVHSGPLNSAVFNKEGRYVVTASTDNSARIWSVPDGTLTGNLVGHTTVVTSANFSADGKYLVTASWDNTAKIWNAVDGKLLSELRGHTDWINSATFSADGNFVVTASSDNTAKIWKVPDGKLMKELKGHTDWVASAIFSADGKYVVSTSWDNTARIFLASTGESVAVLKGHTDYLKWINFSNNGRYIVTAASDNTARIWSMPDGKMLHELKGHRDKVRTAEFTKDDKYIVTSSYDSTARIWDVESGMLAGEFLGHTGALNSAMLSPDGKNVTTSSTDNTARIWSLKDRTLQYVLKGHSGSINSARYSKDGKRIVLASIDNTASIWDAENGNMLYLLKGHSGALKSAAFSPDRHFIVTTSEDNTLKKWDAENGKFLYTFFAVDSSGYLAIDSEGHYDGSENARKMLYYVCGNEIVDLEQFKDLSWEPGLVTKLTGINKEPITAKKIDDINICNYTPLVEEKESVNGSYNYIITPRSGGIGEIQLYVNGKLVEKYDPATLLKKKNAYLLQVKKNKVEDYFISGPYNLVTVKATTSGGLMVSRGANMVASGIKKPLAHPNMYLISVGISNYKGEKIKLKYASKDAVDFISAMSGSAEKLLNTDGKQHVFSYALNTETGSARWPIKSDIEKLIDSISKKATSDDIIIMFFAGHGILQSGQKNFYLLTAEATSADMTGIEKEVAISTDELKEWLRKIKANKQLLIIDACNSGQVVRQFQELVGKREVPADQQRALESLKDKTGTFILCASAAGQSAYETSLYGQGLLTYSLLSGIKFGNGLKENKFIDITKWFNYASDNVKVMAREIGGRQDPQIIGNASFDIGLVDKEIVENIHLASKKKAFKRSRFIEDEELLSDDLDLSYLVDQNLNSNSGAGKENPLVFVGDNPLLEAYTIRGKYQVTDNKVTGKVSVFKGQKERIYQFDINGSADKKEDIAEKIVDNIKIFLNQQQKNGL